MSKKIEHTAGPWRVAPDGMHPRSTRRVIKGGDPERSLIIVEDWTKEADAVLMAAAPDLLAACEVLSANAAKSAGDWYSVRPQDLAALRAAIAKAKGGAS